MLDETNEVSTTAAYMVLVYRYKREKLTANGGYCWLPFLSFYCFGIDGDVGILPLIASSLLVVVVLMLLFRCSCCVEQPRSSHLNTKYPVPVYGLRVACVRGCARVALSSNTHKKSNERTNCTHSMDTLWGQSTWI